MSQSQTTRGPGPGLHRCAVLLACGVVLLITAGALVKSKEAGLSVPDWPLSYGSLNPPRWWEIENVRAEHGHRLIAGTIALATVALAIWIGRRDPRRWVRRLAWLAVAAVFAQALLGGITVLLFLPTAVSASHAALAQIFLCLTVTLAIVTSPAWRRGAVSATPSGRPPWRLATATTGMIYLQILIGAVMRHSGAGLAIPDFPLVFGGLIPPRFDFAIAIHYTHRLGALAVAILVLTTAYRALRRPRQPLGLRLPAAGMAGLVAVQIGLGGAVILTAKGVLPNTLHVATGAMLLATSLILTVNCWRAVHSASARRRSPQPVGEMLREAAS